MDKATLLFLEKEIPYLKVLKSWLDEEKEKPSSKLGVESTSSVGVQTVLKEAKQCEAQ